MSTIAVLGLIVSTAVSCIEGTTVPSDGAASTDSDTALTDGGDTQDSEIDPSLHPQYRLSPLHTGVSAQGASISSNIHLVWQSEAFGIGDYSASKSSPAVDDDRLYIGVDDGRLLALDRNDGSLIWQFKTHRYDTEQTVAGRLHLGIHGSPAFDDAYVYIGDYDGFLYAVDKRDGTLQWVRKLGDSIGASPTVHDGAIYMAVEFAEPDGRVFVVEAANGEELWSTPFLGEQPHSTVSIDTERNLMFVGANNGRLFCFDIGSHQPVWTFDADGEIKSTAAVSGDTVYVTSWDQKLHAIAIETGLEKFSFPTLDVSMSSPSVFQGRVYFGSHDTQLYGVEIASGRAVFTVNTNGAILSSPTVVQDSGLLVVGSRDRSLYLVDLNDGAVVGSFNLPGGISSVPVVVGNTLFVNDDNGTVSCFDFP
jgi:outer membrane protein assembly factor BamB